ncbi:unnamed protein product [Urochloa decumbens]|uniref:DUF1618 domain-containing protein n=1 Tax=Urochloa decumbens TaxID=240449 RepID=A0ABC8ZEV5_9POAL
MPPEPCSSFPDSVLLDPIAHVGRPLRNATTAVTLTTTLSPIEVSFDVADPPGLTRCVVTCPEAMLVGTPRVIAADGAFLLLVVGFPRSDVRVQGTLADYFVYRAGPGAPSLLLLRLPPQISNLYSMHAGVLSCGGGRHCLVVLPERRLDDFRYRVMSYDLHVFSTETGSWTTRAARVASDLQGRGSPLLRHEPTKVFSVGGSSLAWVDLSLGVLLCDMLGSKDDDLEMRLIDLPPLMPTNNGKGPRHSLPAVRDVICRDGWIRCVEIEFPEQSETNPTEFPWTATVSTKKRMFSSDEWETFTVDSDSLLPAGSCFADLFPEIWDEGKGKLTLNKVLSVKPVLDAHQENVVYMKSKLMMKPCKPTGHWDIPKPCEPKGWVIAIDTRDKRLVRVAPFPARKLYFDHYYLQCDFSKYISKAPDTNITIVSTESISKKVWLPLVSYVFSILVVQQQFRDFEESLTQRRGHCYLEARQSLLPSGLASTLYVNIQELAQYATSKGLGEAATDAVNVFLRAYKELGNLLSGDLLNGPSAWDETVRDNIDIAVGALDGLLHTVPSRVLHAGRRALAVACMDHG